MLNMLYAIHTETMKATPQGLQRYLYTEIPWNNQAVGIFGDCGVGKTSLVCQHLQKVYSGPQQGLYLAADNLNVLSVGLSQIAQEYFSAGGSALCIDHVHKYPEWGAEIQSILATYKTKKIILVGSNAIELSQHMPSPHRITPFQLRGLSFREFLSFRYNLNYPTYSLQTILHDHLTLAAEFSGIPILKYFQEYLRQGYYPFCATESDRYFHKLQQLIEKVIYEDLAVIFGLKQSTLPVLKQILWQIATADSQKPNIDKISKTLGVSRENVYSCVQYLHQAGLLLNLFSERKQSKLVRKPAKAYLQNTNLLQAIYAGNQPNFTQNIQSQILLANQISARHTIQLHDTADFIIDQKYCLSIDQSSAQTNPTFSSNNNHLIADNIDIGNDQKIPLYLFGFLY